MASEFMGLEVSVVATSDLARLRQEHTDMRDTLTHCQARNTQLLQRARDAEAERDRLSDLLDMAIADYAAAMYTLRIAALD